MSCSGVKAFTIQFGVTNSLTNSAPLSLRDVKLRYEECLQNWGNTMVPTLELIKTAVLNGELDTQIDAAANKLRDGFAQ